jgi:aarF domain-containing kinase
MEQKTHRHQRRHGHDHLRLATMWVLAGSVACAFLLSSNSNSITIEVEAFTFTSPVTRPGTVQRPTSSLSMSTVSDMSRQMAEMRKDMAENEEANLMMQALRGQNIDDSDQAAAGLDMKLVDVNEGYSGTETDVLKTTYDPVSLKAFFSKRPRAVARRVFQVLSVGGGYLAKLAFDAALGRDPKKDPELEIRRTRELRDIITSLGPFFIKLGQALSIRPDVLSPRSMVELQKLCDKVPSYDSRIAFAAIEKELGRTIDDLFTEITPEPIAAASLGQVYKAVLRDTGDLVAVKVQRPSVLETVSLDLHLARELGMLARNFPALSDRLDAVALLDEFAYRFYQELDYVVECQNGITIREQMSVLPMVVIPKNYPQYTSRRVHVAEWVDGEKLSQSKADDVGALVNLGVITYLTQLLEFGFFHADPHRE